MKLSSFAVVGVAFLALSAGAQAATITWNFDNVTGAGTPTVATAPPSSGSAANLTIGNVSASSSVAASVGVYNNVSFASAGASGVNNFGLYVAPLGSESISFTVTPDPGFAVRLSDLDYYARSTSTGPLKYDIQWSADSFGSTIATASRTAASAIEVINNTFSPVTDLVSEPVTIRILLSNGTGGAGSAANYRMDDLVANLEAIAVPEPSSLMLLVAAVVGLALAKRR